MTVSPRRLIPEGLTGSLLLSLVAVYLVGAGVLFALLYQWGMQDLVEAERAKLKAAAAVLGKQIDPMEHERVSAEHPTLGEVEDWEEASEATRALRERVLQAAIGAKLEAPVYTLRLREDLAAEVAREPEITHPGALEVMVSSSSSPTWRERRDYTPEVGGAMLRGKTVATDIYADERGHWITVYEPLVDQPSNRAVAAVVMEVPMEPRLAALAGRLAQQALLLAGTLLGVVAVSIFMGMRFSGALSSLGAAVSQLASGDFDEPILVAGPQTFAELGVELDAVREEVVRKLKQRDAEIRGLKESLEDLRSQIDPRVAARRERIEQARAKLSLLLRVGMREFSCATVLDLTSNQLVIQLPAGQPALAVGTPLAARIALDGGDPLNLRGCVSDRREKSESVEYRIALAKPLDQVQNLSGGLSDLIFSRSETRVKPDPAEPIMVELKGAEGELLASDLLAENISVAGIGLSVPEAPEVVAGWGTEVKLAVRLPGVRRPARFSGTIRNLEAVPGGSRLGIALDQDAPGFSRQWSRLESYVAARSEGGSGVVSEEAA